MSTTNVVNLLVGVDVSKDMLDAYAPDPPISANALPMMQQAMPLFVAWVKPPRPRPHRLESTSPYQKAAVGCLAGRRPASPSSSIPRQVATISPRAPASLAKTDAIDAAIWPTSARWSRPPSVRWSPKDILEFREIYDRRPTPSVCSR